MAILEQSPVRASADAERRITDEGSLILVATDASASSDAALRAAQAIALHTLASIRLVAVHIPVPIVAPEVAIAESPEVEGERRQALQSRVRAQIARVGVIFDWPVDVVSGDPAAMIARIARESDAALVIMGLGEHGLLDRILGGETVLRLLRLGSVPVLAVAPTLSEVPLRVLAATDFSPSSARALALAGQLIHSFARVTLAHVAAGDGVPGRAPSGDDGFTDDIGRALDRVIADSGLRPSITVSRKVWHGDPAKVLLDASKKMKPDLIVAGSHGYGLLTRWMLGSVSQRLVRGAGCSILVAPPESGASYLEEISPTASRITSSVWAEQLEEFSRRNASRFATLEVLDPDIGAQVEEKGLRFLGASYEPRSGLVHIMLGDGVIPGRHLTRSIAGASAVQVVRDRSGADLLLRVAHGHGQSFLTLER